MGHCKRTTAAYVVLNKGARATRFYHIMLCYSEPVESENRPFGAGKNIYVLVQEIQVCMLVKQLDQRLHTLSKQASKEERRDRRDQKPDLVRRRSENRQAKTVPQPGDLSTFISAGAHQVWFRHRLSN